MSDLGPVVVRCTVAAPQAQVWQMLVDDAARASWWPGLQITPEVGGEVVHGDLSGAVDVVVNDLTLGFRWRRADDESDRTVVVMLRPEDDDFDLTRVTVIESGFAVLPDAAEVVFASTSAWEERFNALNLAVTPELSDQVDAGDVETVGVDEDHDEAADHADGAVDSDAPVETDASGHPEVADHSESQVHDAAEMEDEADATDVDAETDTETDPEVDNTDDAEIDMSDIDVSEGDEVGVFTAEVSTDFGDHNIIEIVTEEVIDAETIEETDGIYLPEVSGAPFTDSVVQITSDLGVDEPVEVDETSEWERLLRGDDLDDRH